LKILLFIIVIGVISVFGVNAFRLERGARACNLEFQDSMEPGIIRSQTVLADREAGCLTSFTGLTDWDMCLTKAENRVSPRFRVMLRPIVSNLMLFFREKEKDMMMLKREHDERCSDYPDLMFFPPEIGR